jgi:hypothetical protein
MLGPRGCARSAIPRIRLTPCHLRDHADWLSHHELSRPFLFVKLTSPRYLERAVGSSIFVFSLFLLAKNQFNR